MRVLSEKYMWLALLVLGVIGGVYAYWKLKDTDKGRARKLLAFGIVMSVLGAVVRR